MVHGVETKEEIFNDGYEEIDTFSGIDNGDDRITSSAIM